MRNVRKSERGDSSPTALSDDFDPHFRMGTQLVGELDAIGKGPSPSIPSARVTRPSLPSVLGSAMAGCLSLLCVLWNAMGHWALSDCSASFYLNRVGTTPIFWPALGRYTNGELLNPSPEAGSDYVQLPSQYKESWRTFYRRRDRANAAKSAGGATEESHSESDRDSDSESHASIRPTQPEAPINLGVQELEDNNTQGPEPEYECDQCTQLHEAMLDVQEGAQRLFDVTIHELEDLQTRMITAENKRDAALFQLKKTRKLLKRALEENESLNLVSYSRYNQVKRLHGEIVSTKSNRVNNRTLDGGGDDAGRVRGGGGKVEGKTEAGGRSSSVVCAVVCTGGERDIEELASGASRVADEHGVEVVSCRASKQGGKRAREGSAVLARAVSGWQDARRAPMVLLHPKERRFRSLTVIEWYGVAMASSTLKGAGWRSASWKSPLVTPMGSKGS
ncbi:hypothetical protein K438DRAFT_1751321 [Mycena galopus ATCC 62051]|nr:hypothetical protein K438DRAFT_1751321 [Mycena galopus ATCC 62051]